MMKSVSTSLMDLRPQQQSLRDNGACTHGSSMVEEWEKRTRVEEVENVTRKERGWLGGAKWESAASEERCQVIGSEDEWKIICTMKGSEVE